MAQDFAVSFGQTFLDLFVERTARQLSAEMVTVGIFRLFETERVMVCASSLEDNNRETFEYETSVAPCHEVVLQGAAKIVKRDIQTLYPKDRFFQVFGFHSYVGYPLKNSVGETIGLVQVSWKRAVDQSLCDAALEIFETFADRLGNELETQAKMSMLGALVTKTENPNSETQFPFLAQTLQSALSMKTAFVAECIEEQPDKFRILGYCLAGKTIPELEGALVPYEGTPCGRLRGHSKVVIDSGLQDMFPDQISFVELGLEAYIGIALRDENGKTVGHVAVQNDRHISERLAESDLMFLLAKRIETELLRYRADTLRKTVETALLVQKKNESLGLLAGSISHDFNNLLASMVGHTEIALEQLTETHAAFDSLKTIQACLDTSTGLVRQLLDYAKGSPSTQTCTINLNDVVQDAAKLLPVSQAQFDLSLPDPDQELPIVADRTQLLQLLMNIILNATEAPTDEPLKVTVRAFHRALTPAEEATLIFQPSDISGDRILLEIIDNGSGMPPETASKVFDPYFTTKQNGKGLGMAAALGIARRHNAALAMDTAEGKGTKFTIIFPHAPKPKTTGEGQPADPAQITGASVGARKKILIVDDEPVLLDMLKTVLTRADYTVFTADGHNAALRQSKENGPFDYTLVDVSMPVKNGWETVSALLAQQPDLNFAMMSGFSITPTQAGYPELEGTLLLDKPFRPSKLVSVLSKVFAQ